MSARATRWDEDAPLPRARARPVTPLHRVEHAAARALLAWSGRRGVDHASDGLGRLARRAGPFLRPVHRRGLENLALVMPDLTAAEREAVLRDEWENLGRTAAEYAHLPELTAERVTVRGGERLAAMVRQGRQAVFVSGHLANWELMASTLHRLGLRAAVVYRAANNPLVDRAVIDLRAEVMTRRLVPKGKRGGRELMAALRDGLSLCLLTDQKLGDGVEAPLLGRPALTAPAPARLALKAGLPVIPLQIVRLGGARFVVTVHEPLEVLRTGDAQADTLALTVAINDALSGFIREAPGQWLWFHRRWPRPPGRRVGPTGLRRGAG